MEALIIIYESIVLLILFYCTHRAYLLARYVYYSFKDRYYPQNEIFHISVESELPVVTIQLPIFNERLVVKRLIDSVMQVNYPKHLLEVQVLDDSIDETTTIARTLVEEYQVKGFDITLIHRTNRKGYKAGALEEGMAKAKGEFLVIFDSDFVPPKEYLREAIMYFTDSSIGVVQLAWSYINRNDSWLTKTQALFLDAHFFVEHHVRHRAGLFFNFNGTAGIWRKIAIKDAGGWSDKTITEDLELSYRAQMNGWKFKYLSHLHIDSELPRNMHAYKSQRFRWAMGAIQTFLLLYPRILKTRSVSITQKIEAFFHLSGNFAYLLTALIILGVVPFQTFNIYIGNSVSFFDASFLISILVVTYLFVATAHWQAIQKILISPIQILYVFALGTGTALYLSQAIIYALFGRTMEFVRTPKEGESSTNVHYRPIISRFYRVELSVAFLLLAAAGFISYAGEYQLLPFFILSCWGQFYVGGLSLYEDVCYYSNAQRRR